MAQWLAQDAYIIKVVGSNPVLTTMKNETNNWKQGLSNGHIAQIVRRKNVVRVVESKKVYNRKKVNSKI